MRTTLTIDDDILSAAQTLARREKRSVGAVLSDLARATLSGGASAGPAPTQARHGFRPLPHRGAIVTNDLIDRLREDEPE